MATTTPNFGWSVPTSTDLVKDGATAIETLGDAIDASLVDLKGGTTGQVLSKNSGTDMDFTWVSDATGMTNPMTTTGDTIYSSSGSTPARLGIGTTGQILTVAGGVPSWATPSVAGTSWTLLNAGGTALTGAATVTVSGISGQNKILVLIQNASSASASSAMRVRLNTDTAANYYNYGFNEIRSSTYDPGDMGGFYDAETGVFIGYMSGTASSPVVGAVLFDGCNTSGVKSFSSTGAGRGQGSNGQQGYILQGYYNSASTITSVSINSGTGNLDAGTIFVYTSA
jgi:hypothetical protein